MDHTKYDATFLLIDEDLKPALTISEAQALKPIQKKFMESYLQHRDSMPLEKWLHTEMAENLPDHSSEEITQMSKEILTALQMAEEKRYPWKEQLRMVKAKNHGLPVKQ